MMHSQPVGRIERRRFTITEKTVLDELRQRLEGEKDVSVRRYIRLKITLFS